MRVSHRDPLKHSASKVLYKRPLLCHINIIHNYSYCAWCKAKAGLQTGIIRQLLRLSGVHKAPGSMCAWLREILWNTPTWSNMHHWFTASAECLLVPSVEYLHFILLRLTCLESDLFLKNHVRHTEYFFFMYALMCGRDLEVGYIVLTVQIPINMCLHYLFKAVCLK